MQANDYLDFTDTTVSKNAPVIGNVDLIHGAIGISNEAGELLGLIKKMMFNNKHVTTAQIADELSDVIWYVARVLRGLDLTFEELFDINADKLRQRYEGSYSDAKAAAQADKWAGLGPVDHLSADAWKAGFNGA